MEWFENWFDSPYYHVLYQNRDDDEAGFFIKNLLNHLKLPPSAKVLDLACGKGRHAAILAKEGYNTMGVDLSANSINQANSIQVDNLRFAVQDMRFPLQESFDGIFNLFTSFGYFNSTSENLKVLKSIETMLNSNGVALIDFMNARKVINQLVPEETKTIQGITFHLNRKVTDGQIIKSIRFNDNGKTYQFEERVQSLTLDDFKHLINQTNLSLVNTFGNYKLDEFSETNSDRLILELRK